MWFSPGTLISSINKNNRHDITKILLKVTLNTITTQEGDGRLLNVLYIVSVKSSGTITSTQEEMKAMGGHIKNSQRLITKYDRRQFTDKLLIMLAVLFFFVTVLYTPIILRVRFPVRRGVLNTLCDKVCQ
jgi:protein transport protein SEC20